VIACPESEEYRRIDAMMGDTIIMSCNATPSSGAEWTRNTTYGDFSYVYVNGTIRGYLNIMLQYSVVDPGAGDYSLRIYNVHTTDSGVYDCYETDRRPGKRIVGYYLVAEGMFLVAL